MSKSQEAQPTAPPSYNQPGQTVATQPVPSVVTAQQQVVIVNNQQAADDKIRPWSTGICGCCEDIGSCCCGFFCLSCLACRLSSRLHENCCVPMCLPGGLMALRTKLRTQYNIVGSICGDWCIMCCCGPLGICQMSRELDHVGV